jgi:hypothetical protein
MWLGLVLGGCGERPFCEEGQIRQGERCVRYQADEPVPSEAAPIPVGASWQWQLTGEPDLSYDVDVYDLDLFEISDEVIDQVHDDGRLLVCYMSAGSYEPWRPDADAFPKDAIGEPLDGWEEERWLDFMDPRVRELMEARLDLAVERGCDGIEPDNLTAFAEDNGFGLNMTEQLDYNRFLADAAHERGLGIALKNDVEQARELVDWFDYSVNEECARYDECRRLQPFLDAGKAVLHTEYVERWGDAPAAAEEYCGVLQGLSTLIKRLDLGPEYLACD